MRQKLQKLQSSSGLKEVVSGHTLKREIYSPRMKRKRRKRER